MNPTHDIHDFGNFRPLICPQVRRTRSRTSVADVVSLHPHRHWRAWRAVWTPLMVVASVLAFATTTIVLLISLAQGG